MRVLRIGIAICLAGAAGLGLAQTMAPAVGDYRKAEIGRITVGETVTTQIAGVPMGAGKICSVFVPNQWRDSLSVADKWSLASCRDYMLKMGGVWYQLGCMQPAGAVFGEVNGGGPTPNCGW